MHGVFSPNGVCKVFCRRGYVPLWYCRVSHTMVLLAHWGFIALLLALAECGAADDLRSKMHIKWSCLPSSPYIFLKHIGLALGIMSLIPKSRFNVDETIPKPQSRWKTETYDDEAILMQIIQSYPKNHPKMDWTVIAERFNESVPPSRKRTYDSIYSKWRNMKRLKNTATVKASASREPERSVHSFMFLLLRHSC